MARDPKNFTGENIPALLDADRKHRDSVDSWAMLGYFMLSVLGLAALIACVVSALR